MTLAHSAAAMRRIADVIDEVNRRMGRDVDTGKPKPMLEAEPAAGAAVMLCYLRDLVTCGNRDHFDRGTLLVILETISRDPEIFPCGIGQVLWQAEDLNEEKDATNDTI